ncbi:hypothetical protein [Pseudomonas sp. EpS/L25]|uniref:hypothetical protein n=1 Tax=Pseudomonas sp. EpS/L25 TaxID=1749078 RepID=UPI0007436B0F|nr:hypothetical protein [Pseudomonas sp. EpS/L25]KUM34175.1 hypothetical protein AR540_15725 [Pseudomonas sp. EpS/L25]
MYVLTQHFVSCLKNIDCLFGPLAPDGALPVRLSDKDGRRHVTLILDIARLQDARYCEQQAQQARSSLAV